MKELDIERELLDLAKKEEVLAFFDFVLTLPIGAERRDVEGLCKVSRPRERNSRATYFSLFFVVDSQEATVQQAVEQAMRDADWNAFGEKTAGVDCVLPVPHRGATAGLFLKEVDVYLDGSRAADTSFVREAILAGVAATLSLRPGELTIWEQEPSSTSPAAEKSESLLDRLRRLAGLS